MLCIGPRDGSLRPEPSYQEAINTARHSPTFAQELLKLKRRQAAQQMGPPVRQQLAPDGLPLVTKLLGGRPPSPVVVVPRE